MSTDPPPPPPPQPEVSSLAKSSALEEIRALGLELHNKIHEAVMWAIKHLTA
jgi:hypothetical protein